MRVLVAVASRHESTTEIGERISEVLRAALGETDPHVTVDLREVGTVNTIEEYDAVLLGSAIYLGRWLKPARHFARAHAGSLRHRPVWLFSSGPVGDPLVPSLEPADVSDALDLTGAREHKLFAGRLRTADLGTAERAAVHAVEATEGDFRDWAEITAWAGQVAEDLIGSRTGSA